MARKSAPSQDKLSALGIEEICWRISQCETLQMIADSVGINKRQVWDWLQKFPHQYARALEDRADKVVEDILAIADTPKLGVTTKINDDGKTETTEGDMIQHRRLQVDARKWLAGKMAPKKYGDKIEQTVQGSLTVSTVNYAHNPK